MTSTGTLNLNPLDVALLEIGQPVSDLVWPPKDWVILQSWGDGWALANRSGLRVIIDAELKGDGQRWVHVSVSRKKWIPSHEDMCLVKTAFLGDRYAYAVYPPRSEYVNIHPNCLHLWALVDHHKGRVLPEFNAEIGGVKSI